MGWLNSTNRPIENQVSGLPVLWVSLVLEMENSMLAKETLQQSCGNGTCKPVQIGPVTIPSIGLEGGF